MKIAELVMKLDQRLLRAILTSFYLSLYNEGESGLLQHLKKE